MIRIYKYFHILIFFYVVFANDITSSRENAITRAIRLVGPAVASINVEQHTASVSFDPFFGFMYPKEIYPMKNSGSGVVISPDGFLMTNYHVVENAEKITATLSGGDEFNAEIIGFDQISDLALLKLDGSNFPYAVLGDSDELIIGEWVIALGNPFELFTISNNPSASVGIVSGLNMDFGMQKSGKVLQDMIQTDAAINPGNSGGPLIDASGKVIGINTFIFTDYDDHFRGSVGIGFAIPINTARRIAEELRINGEIDRGYSTGLVVQTVTRSISRYLNLPEGSGVIIVNIVKNSSAEKAGLRLGDFIIKVNDESIDKPSDIRKIILENDIRSGDTLRMKIYRDGNIRFIKMKLGKFIK